MAQSEYAQQLVGELTSGIVFTGQRHPNLPAGVGGDEMASSLHFSEHLGFLVSSSGAGRLALIGFTPAEYDGESVPNVWESDFHVPGQRYRRPDTAARVRDGGTPAQRLFNTQEAAMGVRGKEVYMGDLAVWSVSLSDKIECDTQESRPTTIVDLRPGAQTRSLYGSNLLIAGVRRRSLKNAMTNEQDLALLGSPLGHRLRQRRRRAPNVDDVEPSFALVLDNTPVIRIGTAPALGKARREQREHERRRGVTGHHF